MSLLFISSFPLVFVDHVFCRCSCRDDAASHALIGRAAAETLTAPVTGSEGRDYCSIDDDSLLLCLRGIEDEGHAPLALERLFLLPAWPLAFDGPMTSRFMRRSATLKPVTGRDTATLLEFIRAYYRFDRIPFNPKTTASALSLLLKEPTLGRAWLILTRGHPVGYLVLTFGFDLEFGGPQATLTDLYVRARHRGKGIGRQALATVEAFCKSCGVKTLELQVTHRNKRALKFYRSLGFEAHTRIPMSKRIAL
jgi:GNAT superfamily N-acetyltransferase